MNRHYHQRFCRVLDWAKSLHQDQSGSISLASVFALILLAFLLGLVMNSARQADQRVKLQNTADAAARSGGVVLARGMNTIAFSNHLMSDVFALTAFYREANAQGTGENIPEILEHWRRVAPHLASSEFPKFAQLGEEILQKLPVEEQMVIGYLTWALAASEQMLPVLETILAQELIPQYQRAVLFHTPQIAQAAVEAIAQRHAESWPAPVETHAVFWRTMAEPVGGPSEEILRTLPVVDPLLDALPNQNEVIDEARETRDSLAHRYLREWNNESLRGFDQYGKMSQLANLWRSMTCGQLERLLEDEYPMMNLPMSLRDPSLFVSPQLTVLERDYMFVAVVYAKPIPDRVPRIFQNPLAADQISIAQVQVFVPRRRLRTGNVVHHFDRGINFSDTRHLGGMPRDFVNDPPLQPPNRSARSDRRVYWWDHHHYLDWLLGTRREGSNTRGEVWSVMNQNWETQLVPATATMMPSIASQPPGLSGTESIQPPNLSTLSSSDFQQLIQH